MKKDFVSLAEARPDLAKEWNYEKNGDLRPEDVGYKSNKKVWWIYHYDVPDDYPVERLRGKHFKFEWRAFVNNRNRGKHSNGCPFLNGEMVWKGYNDLETVNPELAVQWHPTKNGELKPTQVTANSNKKVWWLFSYDIPIDYPIEHLRGKHFNFEWQASISKRNVGHDCPFFCGQAVCEGFNDLRTVNPELAKQWHPTKNGDLKPTQVTTNSTKRVWWMYSYDDPNTGRHFNFEWKASIGDRNKNQGCPYLSGQAVWEGFNDLATVNPSLAKLWHPTKNGDLKPEQVVSGSGRRVWWLLQYDDPKTRKHFDFEWQASIHNRTKGANCPFLTTYRGENYIKQYLQKKQYFFNTQQKFPDLFGTGDGQLSYDFSIPDEKFGYILIEYNGIQHYEANDFFGGEEQLKKQKEHDKRKRDYAKKHGYKLITIKYTYDTYESVEEYLDNELKKAWRHKWY